MLCLSVYSLKHYTDLHLYLRLSSLSVVGRPVKHVRQLEPRSFVGIGSTAPCMHEEAGQYCGCAVCLRLATPSSK